MYLFEKIRGVAARQIFLSDFWLLAPFARQSKHGDCAMRHRKRGAPRPVSSYAQCRL